MVRRSKKWSAVWASHSLMPESVTVPAQFWWTAWKGFFTYRQKVLSLQSGTLIPPATTLQDFRIVLTSQWQRERSAPGIKFTFIQTFEHLIKSPYRKCVSTRPLLHAKKNRIIVLKTLEREKRKNKWKKREDMKERWKSGSERERKSRGEIRIKRENMIERNAERACGNRETNRKRKKRKELRKKILNKIK